MTEGTEPGRAPPRRSLLRNPFLWGGLFAVLVLGAILLAGRPASSAGWPAALYLSEADAAKSRWLLRPAPGEAPLPLDWSSMTSRVTSSNEGIEAFELSLDLFHPAKDPVRRFLVALGPWREPGRTYSTKGEAVEKDGARWFVLRPE